MSQSLEKQPARRWPRDVWSRADLAWLSGLCLPVLVYAIDLKRQRIATRKITLDAHTALALFWSEFAAQLAFVLFGLGLLALSRGRFGSVFARFFLSLFGVLCVLLLLGSHGFFMSSGTSLDFTMLSFTLQNIGQMAKVVASARTPGRLFAVGMAITCVLFLPWILQKLVGTREILVNARRALFSAALAFILSMTTVAVALRVPSSYEIDVSRDSLLGLIATLRLGSAEDDPASIKRAASWARGPEQLIATHETKRKNVVLIMLESTGAWATSVYGGPYETTPELKALAQKSVVLEHMRAVIPHTTKALVAIMCGVAPRPGIGAPEALKGGLPAHCLPSLLAEHGYHTLLMQAATHEFESRNQLADNMGFAEFISGDEMDATGLTLANYFGYEDRILLKPVREQLKRAKASQKPLFFAILTNTPHHDYRFVGAYGRRHYTDNLLEDRYLNSVRYDDFILRDIVRDLESLDMMKDTILIIVGDHGEGFNQHGRKAHDEVIYEEGLHVPFVLYEQGRLPERRAGAFNELDIAPTIVDVLRLQMKGAYQGQSVFAPLKKRVLYASCYGDERCVARYEGSQKFIHHFGRRRDELFDLARDANETVDLISPTKNFDRERDDVVGWYNAACAFYRDAGENATRLLVTKTPPEKIKHPFKVRYGDAIELLGWDSSKEVVEPGGWVNITWYIHVLDDLDSGNAMEIFGMDGAHRHFFGHVPVQRMYPETEWQEGDYIRDVHRIRVPATWTADKFNVHFGFFEKGRKRLSTKPTYLRDVPRVVELPIVHR